MQRLQRQVLPPAEDLNSTTMWMWESGTHTFCFFCFPHGDVSRSSLGTVISFFFCIIVHIDFFSFRLFFFHPLKKTINTIKEALFTNSMRFRLERSLQEKTQEREKHEDGRVSHCFTLFDSLRCTVWFSTRVTTYWTGNMQTQSSWNQHEDNWHGGNKILSRVTESRPKTTVLTPFYKYKCKLRI